MTNLSVRAYILAVLSFEMACGSGPKSIGNDAFPADIWDTSVGDTGDRPPNDGYDARAGEVGDTPSDGSRDGSADSAGDNSVGEVSDAGASEIGHADAREVSSGDAGVFSAGETIIRTIAATDYLDSIGDDTYPIVMQSGETDMVSRTSRLASLEGTFDGSKPLVVRVISSYPGGQNNMPVFIDGTFQVDAFGIAYTHVNYTILAGPGSHGFKIWTAQQTRGAAYLGTWVDELDGMGLNVSTNQSASRVLVSLGDSIAGGGNAGNPSRFGINALLRSDFPGRVVDIGYGMLRLFDKTPAAWTADVVRAAGLSGAPRIDVVNLAGTNDYGMPAQSAAAYGSELGAWADAVIAALPAARIVIVEILPRSPEPANAFGDTPAAFRAQQASVVATRASFCQLVTASTMSLTPPDGSDYAGDGLHLSDPGHAKVKARIKSIIGY